jgi:hypothetical protein
LKKVDHNIGFEKNANFFAENWRKSQKVVIITSTPGGVAQWAPHPPQEQKTRVKKPSG